MLLKIVFLPFTLVKTVIGIILKLIKTIISTILGLVRFVISRIFGTAFGALIGFFLGSGSVAIKMPWSKKKKKKAAPKKKVDA